MPEPIYTLAEAAALKRVSTRTLRRAITAGRLRCYRPGRRVLIAESDLERWWASTRAPLPAPTEGMSPVVREMLAALGAARKASSRRR